MPNDTVVRDVVQAVDQNEARAWSDLFRQFGGGIVRFALRHLSGRVGDAAQAAEEVANDAFVELSRKLHRLSHEQEVLPWLMKAAAFIVLRRLRLAGKEHRVDTAAAELLRSAPNSSYNGHESHLEKSHDVEIMYRAYERLSPGEKQILNLRVLENLSLPEVAMMLASPLGTVSSRYYRALKRARTYYSEELDRSTRHK